MHGEYYFNRLYPLQDKVLKITDRCATGFYLTGGTALSRHYFHHRFSDDLDFFMNDSPDFHAQADEVIAALKNTWNESLSVNLKEDTFVRLFISEGDVQLKIDFINDVPLHIGDIVSTELFLKTDNIRNILSNKISALSRDEAKDFADLLFIIRNLSFAWEEVINEAKRKDSWVNELDVSQRLHEFDVARFEGLKWQTEIDLKKFEVQLKQSARDILTGGNNSAIQEL